MILILKKESFCLVGRCWLSKWWLPITVVPETIAECASRSIWAYYKSLHVDWSRYANIQKLISKQMLSFICVKKKRSSFGCWDSIFRVNFVSTHTTPQIIKLVDKAESAYYKAEDVASRLYEELYRWGSICYIICYIQSNLRTIGRFIISPFW